WVSSRRFFKTESGMVLSRKMRGRPGPTASSSPPPPTRSSRGRGLQRAAVHHSAIAMLMTAIIVGLVVVAAAAKTLAMTVIRGPCARWWTDHQPRHEQWLARSARELGTNPLMVHPRHDTQPGSLAG